MIHSDSPTVDHGLTVPRAPETTGRFIVVFAEDTTASDHGLESTAGLELASSGDLQDDASAVASTDTFFEQLGIAVVSADPDQVRALERASVRPENSVLSVSPELVHHVLDNDYVRGYADGVNDLAARVSRGSGASAAPAASVSAIPPVRIFKDTPEFTWGVQAVEALTSNYSGKSVSVAVLDTGFDSGHPDFAGRSVTVKSFVPNESAQDGHGHGTHCIGTAMGPKSPSTGRRYGVAYDANIFAGKVLGNAGSGSDSGILAGINWAIESGCQIISMSLGADVQQVHPPYVAAGKRALDKGVLIVAAAGNNAQRLQGDPGFVGTPANSPYILAVGALNQQLDVTFFSARTLASVNGGQVDVAAPGYQVYSSWPMPTRYNTISGTSMATPHVAGVAALWAEATGFRARELWTMLTAYSNRLLAPSVDVGSGLTICP